MPEKETRPPLDCSDNPEPPFYRLFTEEDRLVQEEWMRRHYEDANDPEVRGVDLYNQQGEFELTYVSARELALILGITREEVEAAAAIEGLIPGGYQVKFENNWWDRAKLSTQNNQTMSEQHNSAAQNQNSAEHERLALNEDPHPMVFKTKASIFPSQTLRERKARLDRCECPIHGRPLFMAGQYSCGDEVLTVLMCSYPMCPVKAHGSYQQDSASLFPNLNFLLQSR